MLFVKFDEVREVLVREGWVALAVGEPIDHLTADARVEVQLALPRLGELLQGVDVLRLELCVRLQQLGVVAAQSLAARLQQPDDLQIHAEIANSATQYPHAYAAPIRRLL